MEIVSEEYKQSMSALMRNQSYIKIDFSVVDTQAKSSTQFASSNQESYSDLDNINDANEVTQGYITMEQGRYVIGSNQIIYNENPTYIQQSYVSHEVSDEHGLFEHNPTIIITSSEVLSTLGLTFNFDSIVNEYPRVIAIRGYLNNVLVGEGNYTIHSYNESLECPMTWDKMELEFVEVLPYHRARLDSIIFGVTKVFDNETVLNAEMVRNCSPISNEIAQNEFSFEITNYDQAYNPDNPQGIYPYVEKNQEINVHYGYEVEEGNIEWVNGGKYVLDGMPTIDQYSVTFKAVDTLGNLNEIYYKGMYYSEGISMYNLALDVLEDAGVENYHLDNYMKNVYTKAPLPLVTHKECLQIIANACQCLLFVNRSGEIQFDVAINPTITISDNGGVEYSSSANAYNNPSKITTDIITMEKDYWHLGDGKIIYNGKDFGTQGYVSSAIADDDGEFTVNPRITINYSIGIPLYEIPLKFGNLVKDFNVYYYDENNDLISSLNITDNTEIEYTIQNQVYECTKVVFEFVRTNPQQRIHVNGIGIGRVNDFYLDFNTSKSTPVVKKQEPIKSVDVKCYNYTSGDERVEIYNEDISVSGSLKLKLTFDEPMENVIVRVTGSNLSNTFDVNYDIYARYGEITIEGNGTCNVLVTGVRMNISSAIISYEVEHRGNVKTLENPLITNVENAQVTAEWIADYYAKRNEYDIEYRGNVEVDAYDMIYAQSLFEQYFPVRVLKNVVSFNGALSGTITARRE